MLMTACASPSPACSARHGKGAGFIGSGTPWRTCPRGSTLWSPRRSARPFLQTDAEAAHQTWRHVADQLRSRWPKLPALMDDSEHDAPAHMPLPPPPPHPRKGLNKGFKRRADVVGIFPNEASITRLIGAVLLEQNDEWLLQHRYMQIEGMAELTPPLTAAAPAKR